jgi:hypothetical protein
MNCALRSAASRLAVCASAALMGALGLPSISAAETNPDFVLPQGTACKDFALGLSIRGRQSGLPRVFRPPRQHRPLA